MKKLALLLTLASILSSCVDGRTEQLKRIADAKEKEIERNRVIILENDKIILKNKITLDSLCRALDIKHERLMRDIERLK